MMNDELRLFIASFYSSRESFACHGQSLHRVVYVRMCLLWGGGGGVGGVTQFVTLQY